MSTVKRLSLTFALLISVLLPQIQASAANLDSHVVVIQGKIDAIAKKQHGLIVDDTGYYLSPNLVIKTASGKIVRHNALYPGRNIRMEVFYTRNNNKTAVIKTIYLLR